MYNVFAATALEGHRIAIFDICLINTLTEHRVTILAVSVAVAALGFTTLFSLRTSFLRNSEMADVNTYSHVLRTDTTSSQESLVYLRTAKEWNRFSEDQRSNAEVRAYSANLSFYGLTVLLASSVIAFLYQNHLWFIPFAVSIALLITAFVITKYKGISKPFSWARWPVNPTPLRRLDIDILMQKHPSLKES